MQLICETLFLPRTSVTITFLTYSSYTSQSIAVVTTATFIPVYLFLPVSILACSHHSHISLHRYTKFHVKRKDHRRRSYDVISILRFYRVVEFSIFLLSFEWVLQQCSASLWLPVALRVVQSVGI